MCHGDRDDAECCHGEHYGESVDWFEPPPHWCPMRQGPVTIRIAEGV